MAQNRRNRLYIYSANVLPVPVRNFAGAARTYNRAGDRNFYVSFSDPDIIEKLLADGWNLKELKQRRDEDDEAKEYRLRIKVRYDKYPPSIYTIAGGVKTLLDEGSLVTLDGAYFENVDLVVSPSKWTANDGREFITAYLETGYFTLEDDPFASKYADEAMSEAKRIMEKRTSTRVVA